MYEVLWSARGILIFATFALNTVCCLCGNISHHPDSRLVWCRLQSRMSRGHEAQCDSCTGTGRHSAYFLTRVLFLCSVFKHLFVSFHSRVYHFKYCNPSHWMFPVTSLSDVSSGRGGAGREVEFAICNLYFATYLPQSQSLTTISAHWVFRHL